MVIYVYNSKNILEGHICQKQENSSIYVHNSILV